MHLFGVEAYGCKTTVITDLTTVVVTIQSLLYVLRPCMSPGRLDPRHRVQILIDDDKVLGLTPVRMTSSPKCRHLKEVTDYTVTNTSSTTEVQILNL